jgi:hypothetical protein
VAPEQADTDAAVLNVSRISDQTFQAEFSAPGDEPTVFSAYAVSVGGEQFLNAQEIGEGRPKKWTVARYRLHTPSVLQIEFARDEAFRSIPRDQRLAAFKKELAGKRLFEDYCACIRIKDSGDLGAPHNNEMQRTKPAPAIELRR